MVINEAAATGMPVISSQHCDIPELIHVGKTGLIATERDTQKLAEHLQYLCEHPERWNALTESMRIHIEKEYNVLRQSQKLAAIYREIISS